MPFMPGSGVPARSWPTNADRPMPNSVRARPVATWLACSVKVSTAKISAIAAPAAAPAMKPTVALCVLSVAAKPEIAPTSIIPSMPRLSTPAFSTIVSPRPA